MRPLLIRQEHFSAPDFSAFISLWLQVRSPRSLRFWLFGSFVLFVDSPRTGFRRSRPLRPSWQLALPVPARHTASLPHDDRPDERISAA
jgi:hypothetical protein